MKRFYVAILLFVFPILVLMGGTEWYVRSLPNIYKDKYDWMEHHAEEVETLVLGNSFTAHGVKPASLPGISYNLAIEGRTYAYDHFLFFHWIGKCANLKLVILPVSYDGFYRTSVGGIGEKMQELYDRIYMDSPFHVYDMSYNIESLYYKPLQKKIRDYLCGESINWDDDGWVALPLSRKTPNWNADYINRASARKSTYRTYGNAADNFQYVSEIAHYCLNHSIQMVLVSTPYTKEYNQYLDERQISYTRHLVDKLQNQFGAKYYDYREDVRFHDDDFFDQSHMSEVGAEKLTKILMEDIHKNNR